MSVPGALLAVPLLLLQGAFAGAAGDSVALKEGENLNLNCTFSTLSDHNFTLQWLNPRNFTIFLNAQQVLRDRRYKLLRYSRDELSIQLSNLTLQDEGIYRCLRYTRRVTARSQNVQILAPPSHPVLEISQDEERGIQLSCHTRGGRPQPQISWLLDNGIELPGDTRHELGADGSSWSSRSTLRVMSYSPTVTATVTATATASCAIGHPALGARRLVAPFTFQNLPSPEQNPESKGLLRKEKDLLLPMLVAALVLVLLIIVLLFMVKLKKAHGAWKRENDVSEQTLESYKSRSNEESPGHEKNGQAGNPKSNMQYVTEEHVETPEKNLETTEKNPECPEKNPGDKSTAINEEIFTCGRETDV
ncbi:cytotoxic and regulatory T-cell molecule [Passerculus sandwichensis]